MFRFCQAYQELCEKTACELNGEMADLFKDSIFLQAKIYAYCYQGALETSEGLLEALEEKWKKAFFHIGKARNAYLKANLELHEREHGKWKGFYANECLTDIKHTAWILEGMMAYLRNMGDGPYFCDWQRELLYSAEDNRITLLTNKENHLTDLAIFEEMEKEWDH